MATKTNSLDAWLKTRDAMAENLSSTLEFLSTEPFSSDPNSAFKKAKVQRDRIVDEMQKLAVAGIKMVDDEVAAGDLVERINGLAKKAQVEADKLKNATKTIGKIISAVDTAASVVTRIGQLPFLPG